MRFVASILLAFSAPAFAGTAAQTLPGDGDVRIDGHLEMRIAEGSFLEPVALAPDIYYGLHRLFVLGVTHSAASQGLIGVGPSLRLNGGGDKYDGLGVESFIPLLNSANLSLAPQVSLLVDSLDAKRYSIKVGALAHISAGPISLVGNPHLAVPLNKTDERDTVVRIPLWIYYHWVPEVSFYGLTGVHDDTFQLGLGVLFSATEVMQVGAQFGWPRFAGDNHALDDTAASLFGQFRF